jgi:hypothetical protein
MLYLNFEYATIVKETGMRRVILILLLAIVSNSALAEWSEIGENEELTAFASFSSIKKHGHRVTMWTMYNYKIPHELDGKTYQSSKAQFEFDCKKNQARILAFSIYPEIMGEGKELYSDTASGKWEPSVPDSLNETRWKTICGQH